VIIQVWISSQFGVLSKHPAAEEKRLLLIRAIFTPAARGCKAPFDAHFTSSGDYASAASPSRSPGSETDYIAWANPKTAGAALGSWEENDLLLIRPVLLIRRALRHLWAWNQCLSCCSGSTPEAVSWRSDEACGSGCKCACSAISDLRRCFLPRGFGPGAVYLRSRIPATAVTTH
jgi:hypothetical protein